MKLRIGLRGKVVSKDKVECSGKRYLNSDCVNIISFVPDHRQPWDCSPTGLAEKTFVPAITYIHGGQPTPMLITASMLKIVRSFILLEEAMKRWKLALSWV